MEKDRVDTIVVGAGPAGISAAYVLAKAGLEVVVFERGRYPGAKNVMGGVLYTPILNRLIPEFWKEAPLERHVVKRRFSLLAPRAEIAFDFRTEDFNHLPYNHSFTVLRAQFDRWFAGKAEEAGAMIITETVVDDLLWEDGRVVGVRARREEGELYANVVICADGANSLLAKKANLRQEFSPDQMVVAVKEVMALPREIIEDRFALSGDEGMAIQYFGDAVKGTFGSGFIYTNRESLSVGVGCTAQELIRKGINPNELLEHFKSHSCVRNLVRGGKSREYLAHLIPEGGYHNLPKLVTHGLILVGDAAGLMNTSFYQEGSNLAMASGVMAAETVIEAEEKGDFSEKALSNYQHKLNRSFVIKDLKKYRNMPQFGAKNPQFFEYYPQLLAEMLTDFFTISEASKGEIEKQVISKLRKEIGLFRLFRDLITLGRGIR